MEELVIYLREATDKKQENVRRRRRRDALRLHLMRTLEYIAENGTFNISSCILDKDTQSLHPTIVEFIEGVRFYLENEPDKTSSSVKDLTLHFGYFLKKLTKTFSRECRRFKFGKSFIFVCSGGVSRSAQARSAPKSVHDVFFLGRKVRLDSFECSRD